MDEITVVGGRDLSGTITVNGSKNGALPLIASTILLKARTTLTDIPDILDIASMQKVAHYLGIESRFKRGELSFKYDDYKPRDLLIDEVKSLRASYYFTPILASELPKFKIALPGGCSFAPRPIDLHRELFRSFGLYSILCDDYLLYESDKLHGTSFDFPYKSVGASINGLLMAAIVKGVTTLSNLALEPEVRLVIDFLKASGVDITCIGDTAIIVGQTFYEAPDRFTNIKDRIEAGTYLILGALLGERIIVKGVPFKHLQALFDLFDDLEIDYSLKNDNVAISKSPIRDSLRIKSGPYPLFPSDLLPILVAYLGNSKEIHIVKDGIYPSRDSYSQELNKLGYVIDRRNQELVIFPKAKDVQSAKVKALDLRGGAALIIGALNNNGETIIEGSHHIKRGYQGIVSKIKKLKGAIDEK